MWDPSAFGLENDSDRKMSPSRISRLAVIAVAAGVLVCACGSRGASPLVPDAGDEEQADARTPDAATCFETPAWSSTCNALAFCGPLILTTCAASGPYARPQGGAIAGGTYGLTQVLAYGCTVEDSATTGQTLQFMAPDEGSGNFSVQGVLVQPPSLPVT